MRQSETNLLSEMRVRLRFESLLTDISTRFVNLPADKIDGEIEDAQRRICECIGLDISALWQVLGEIPRNYVLTHNYRLLEDPPLPERMTADEYFSWCLEHVEAGEVIAVSTEELPVEAAGAVGGGFWGSLIGLIFLNPLLGAAVRAAAGAVSGALTDVGVDDNFMKELAATMTPGSSVLFVLVRKATVDKVLDEMKGTGGKILKTSLSHDDEAKLQAAISAATQ